MTTRRSGTSQVWETPSFRQVMKNRLDEAIGGSGAIVSRNSENLENHCFMKSNNKDEYINHVARVIVQIKNRGTNQPSPSSSVTTGSFVPEMNHNIPFPDIGQNTYPYLTTQGSYPHYHYHPYNVPSNPGPSSTAMGPSSISQRQIGQAQVPNGSVPYHHPSTGLHPNSELFHCQYSQLPSAYMMPTPPSATEDPRQLRLMAWQRYQQQQQQQHQQNMMYQNYLPYSIPPSSSSDYHSYPYNQTAVTWNPQLPVVGSNGSSSTIPNCCPPVVSSKVEDHDHPQSSNSNNTKVVNNNNSKSNNANSERSECTICFERPIDSVYIPCGHLLSCYQCAIEYRKTKNAMVCPICQTPTFDVYKTYTV